MQIIISLYVKPERRYIPVLRRGAGNGNLAPRYRRQAMATVSRQSLDARIIKSLKLKI
jgi:hypothetical protein